MFEIPCFGLRTYINKQLKPWFPTIIALSWSKITKMSNYSNNIRFSGVRFLCNLYLTIKSTFASLNEFYVFEMNIIVITLA